MTQVRIVETDNFDGDYPNESFLLFPMSIEAAKTITDTINTAAGEMHRRYWKIVPIGYVLAPPFEP